MFRNGFTLVELSIVIVIIGILVAAVTAGVEMINQAKLRAVISDFKKYEVAVLAFRARYNQLPGDMINAADYFANCAQTQSNCNGGGNDKINYIDLIGGNTEGGNESVKTFRHLYLANMITEAGTILIPDNYSNHSSNARSGYFPLSRYTGSSYVIVTSNFIPNSNTVARYTCFNGTDYFPPWTPQEAATAIYITETHNDDQIATNCRGGITPTYAHQIDKKIDDGSESAGSLTGATTGSVMGGLSASGNCATGNAYDVTATGDTCIFGLRLQ
jgi:prepilin-type N-terminal cleavage/methylation domain-containing protein